MAASGGEEDVLVGLGIQLSLVATAQQAHEAGHHPQRLLQVVRGHVGKLLEVLVRAGQVVGGLLQGLFGPLAVGDVVHGEDHVPLAIQDERIGADFKPQGHLAPIDRKECLRLHVMDGLPGL